MESEKPPSGLVGVMPPEPNHGGARSKPQDGASGRSSFAPGLYIVATPIGNMADITLRALALLAAADVVACEDTRVTGKLMTRHGISTPRTPYHEHNAGKAGPKLIKRLKGGEIVALVSDAGTPLVSDPGYRLLKTCVEEGIPVTSLPGPSAVLTALTLSGLPTDRFMFAGYLPVRSGARRKVLSDLAAVPATLVFLESPKRLGASLTDMAETLGGREAAVARELTKMFEEVRRGPLSELAEHYKSAGPPKGEVTVVIAPPADAEAKTDAEALDTALNAALAKASLRDAAAIVAGATGLPKRRVYARALELSQIRARDRKR